jgi:hypothetical protein
MISTQAIMVGLPKTTVNLNEDTVEPFSPTSDNFGAQNTGWVDAHDAGSVGARRNDTATRAAVSNLPFWLKKTVVS